MLTPENKRNSQVTKLSPAESSEATHRLTDISENFKPVYKNLRNIVKILSMVAHLVMESFKCLSNFNKKIEATNRNTIKMIFWYYCNDIPEMYPENLRDSLDISNVHRISINK